MELMATIRIALRALARNKMRSTLTMLGIIIGVAAVIAMVALGQGAQQQVQQRIAAMGSNLLYVGAGTVNKGGVHLGMGQTKTLVYDDVTAMLRECPAVATAAPGDQSSAQIVFGNDNWYTRVTGTDFSGATAVKFGGTPASYGVVNDSAITATIPPHTPSVVDVQVTAGGSTSLARLPDRFTYHGNLGGALTSAPEAASWGGGRLDVFGRGTDGGLWHKWREGAQWSSWESLGGALAAGSGLGAVSWSPGRIDVFVKGTDNGLWHKLFDGGKWSGWESLGGPLASGPDVSSWATGRLDVFIRGTDNGLWHKLFADGQWSGWESQGGVLTGDPGAVSWGPDRIDVFIRGTDAGLWHKWFDDGAQWKGWESLRNPQLGTRSSVSGRRCA